MAPNRPIAVSVIPPLSTNVEYYRAASLTVTITNLCNERLLIEEVALRFKSDDGQGTVQVDEQCGCELNPKGGVDQQFQVKPNARYMFRTNYFDIKVRLRVIRDSVGDPEHYVFEHQSYLIIRDPTDKIAKVFVSVKQPEDVALGRLMVRMAGHAGLDAFLKADHDRLAQDIWTEVIEPAMRASAAQIVIWTKHTDWEAKGVEREIAFARELKLHEALLLASETTKPSSYKNTTVEYKYFDRDNAAKHFAEAVDELRHKLMK
jgi:hypothetical protein